MTAVPPNLCAFFRCFGYVLRRVAPALQAVRGATSTNAIASQNALFGQSPLTAFSAGFSSGLAEVRAEKGKASMLCTAE